MAKTYQPPKQSGFGQLIDSLFLIVIVYGSLMMPLLFNFGGNTAPAESPAAAQAVTWDSLNQNPVMRAQWERLGYTPKSAAEIIDTRFHYSVEPISLGVTGLIILGYFVFVLKFSEKEYKEVIAEHFDRNRQ